MRKVIAAEYVSVDGVMEDPQWTAPYWTDELAAIQRELLFESDALLMGRVTYDEMSLAWPESKEGDFADRMNSLPKFVPSTTLYELGWNASLISGNVAEEVARLKNLGEGHLLIYGSGVLVQYLMTHDLIDEHRLMVFPVVLGRGKRLFGRGIKASMRLTMSRSLASGVMVQTYESICSSGFDT